MNLTDLLQTIGIIASIAFAIWQMRMLARNARSMTESALSTKYDQINRLMLDHPALYRSMSGPWTDPDLDDDSDRRDTLAAMIFNGLEQVYIQHRRYRLIDAEEWTIWERAIHNHLQKRYLREWWAQNETQYAGDYRQVVARQVKRLALEAQSARG